MVFEEETGDGLNPFRLQDTPGRQPFFRREHHLPGQSELGRLLLDDKDVAVYRRVKLGSRHDGLRAVKEGLKPEDQVVVAGLKGLRPGMAVKPKKAAGPGQSPP